MTDAAPPTGTIDITNVVESLRTAWVSWAVAYVFGLEVAIPGMAWVALPVISNIDRELLKLAFDFVSKSAEMQVFFLNTAVRKASQAKDFTDTVAKKNALPPSATDQEYADAEKAEILAFRNFVSLSN
jgi:hypothetical protein